MAWHCSFEGHRRCSGRGWCWAVAGTQAGSCSRPRGNHHPQHSTESPTTQSLHMGGAGGNPMAIDCRLRRAAGYTGPAYCLRLEKTSFLQGCRQPVVGGLGDGVADQVRSRKQQKHGGYIPALSLASFNGAGQGLVWSGDRQETAAVYDIRGGRPRLGRELRPA
jgi:hypothetical protein